MYASHFSQSSPQYPIIFFIGYTPPVPYSSSSISRSKMEYFQSSVPEIKRQPCFPYSLSFSIYRSSLIRTLNDGSALKSTVIYSYFFITNHLSMYESLRKVFHYICNKLCLLLSQI